MRRHGSRLGLLLVGLAAAGCGSGASPGGSPPAHAQVAVLYAASLESVMENDLGPAFAQATGHAFEGYGAGSDELVSQLRGGIRRGDVLVSASPEADRSLEGDAGGSYVSWYATFAKAPLVLGYNPQSRFAADLHSRPWYRVVTEPGIRIGRTDPALDPKGRLTVSNVQQAAAALAMPGLTAAMAGWAVFPEETLVGRLEAGQLDAGFFYSMEASEQHIPSVSLLPATASATFTVTVLNRGPDPAGGQAFVAYLLGPAGRKLLSRDGLNLLATSLTGPVTAVPAGLRSLVGG